LELNSLGSTLGKGKWIFLFSPASYQMGTLPLSFEVKRPRREADQLLTLSAEANKYGAVTSLSYVSSWRGVELIKHKNDFRFYL
jgi:hypothetical protein